MALPAIRCGAVHQLPSHLRHPIFPGHNARRQCCFATSTSCSTPKILMSRVNLEPFRSRKSRNSQERIDEWMRESVTEIVKKLPESPLLVQVYSDKSGKSAAMMEKAEERKWELVKKKWEKGEMPMPDGLILVERIEEGGAELDNDNNGEEKSKVWGIVVQGCGQAHACYLLKTTRVRVGSEMGLWCTHFCLMRVKNLRETAVSQLKNCWLLQAQ
ncbi:hypothetical protein SLE2022_065450 [Rubroshorea leprosula]